MFLNKECDYAIRVVRTLADLEKKSVKEICDHEHIPTPFAYKILKKLERAGLVSSHRGSHGGYRLAKQPDHITLHEIIKAVDESVYLHECMKSDHKCPNHSSGNPCGVHQEFERIQGLIESALKEKTIDKVI